MIASVSRYSSVLCISYQSYQASQAMTLHLVEMAASLAQSETLEAAASMDETLSKEYSEESLADKTKAEGLEASAEDLRAESARHQGLADADQLQAEDYQGLAAQAEAESVAVGAEAVVSQGVYREKSEQAVAEAAAASRDEAATESELVGVGICEAIPLIDVVCDVVGTIGVISLQSEAAGMMAESALDASEATAAKAKAESLLARVETLEEEAATNEGLAETATADMEREEGLALEEASEAQAEEEAAADLMEKSEAEAALAEETAAKAEGEEAEAVGSTKTAAEHGIKAFWKAIISEFNAFLSVVFFGARIVIAFLLPTTTAFFGSVLSHVACYKDYGGTKVVTTIANQINAVKGPISYFLGHCGILILGMTVFGPWCSSVLDSNSTYNIRQVGEILLCFAVVVALAQSLLLHAFPLIVSRLRDTSRTTSRLQVFPFVMRILMTIAGGMIYIVPLCVMELCELRLLSKSFFFETGLSTLGIMFISIVLIVSCCTLAMHDDYEENESMFEESQKKETSSSVRMFDDDSGLESALETTRLIEDLSFGAYGSDSMRTKAESTCEMEHNVKDANVLIQPNQQSRQEQNQPSLFHQYVIDLKLPFEILVTTCMLVNLKGSTVILLRLLPDSFKVYNPTTLTARGIGACVVVSLVLWVLLYSLHSMDLGHHGGIWTGNVGKKRRRYQ